VVRGYFIQYKFILPETIKHSSYTYQKLFRAIYGYNQAVYKSNGKRYNYHRAGVLSDHPHVRVGKNCVIIHPAAFTNLLDFFKTGKNPTHKWEGRGDWKAVYYMNEKEVADDKLVSALENLLDRKYVILPNQLPGKILDCLRKIKNSEISEENKTIVLPEAQKIIENDWFKAVYSKSSQLTEFSNIYKELKG